MAICAIHIDTYTDHTAARPKYTHRRTQSKIQKNWRYIRKNVVLMQGQMMCGGPLDMKPIWTKHELRMPCCDNLDELTTATLLVLISSTEMSHICVPNLATLTARA